MTGSSVRAREPATTGRWSSASFRLFFAGSTVSAFGSSISLVALPLLALTVLGASEGDLGLLRGAQLVPFVVLAVPVGLLADRLPRRRIMIVCDLTRVVVMAVVAGLAALGRLPFPGLVALAVVAGCFTVAYEICYLTVLPDLVDDQHLPQANRVIEIAQAGSTIAGPGLGGTLVTAISAAGAVLVDALSFAVSGMFLLLNRWHERPRPAPAHSEPLRRSLAAGARFVAHSRHVGPLTGYLAANNVFAQAFQTALLILVVQDLNLPPAIIGLVVASIGVGFLIGAAVSPPAARHLGLGVVLVGASVIGAVGIGVVTLTTEGPAAPALGAALFGAGSGLFNLQSIAIRQSVTPVELLGRVNAVVKVASYSAMALGAFLGGWVSGLVGAQSVILMAAVGSLLATGCLAHPAIRRLHELPGAAKG